MFIKNRIFLFLLLMFELHSSNTSKEPAKYSKYVKEVIKNFVAEAKENYGLCSMMSGGSMPYDVESIGVFFYTENSLDTIEKARALEIELTQRLNEKINAHDKIRPYLHDYPFPISKTNILIKNFPEASPKKGTIVLVCQKNNIINYASYDGKKFVTEYEENYEEAVEKVKKYRKNQL
jgi:hypothetical protein